MVAVDQKDARTNFKKMFSFRVKWVSAVSSHSQTVGVNTTGAGNWERLGKTGRLAGSRTQTTR